ncbi:hypothetical protein LCGC14_2197740 [marine sediment metagenome]|uniref:Lacal_2735 family protein n=1 Tax=marine sediment metagenome TaxID=412755 RepID=A0A0F9GDD3_9ZZZZ
MLGFLKADPKKKLQKAYEDKLAKALYAQRNGDLRSHGTLMEEAENLYAEIKALDDKTSSAKQ